MATANEESTTKVKEAADSTDYETHARHYAGMYLESAEMDIFGKVMGVGGTLAAGEDAASELLTLFSNVEEFGTMALSVLGDLDEIDGSQEELLALQRSLDALSTATANVDAGYPGLSDWGAQFHSAAIRADPSIAAEEEIMADLGIGMHGDDVDVKVSDLSAEIRTRPLEDRGMIVATTGDQDISREASFTVDAEEIPQLIVELEQLHSELTGGSEQ